VTAVPGAEFPTAALRPHNSRLETRRLRDAFGLHLPHWGSGVERLVDALAREVNGFNV
jgi:dTDP-4-dehydrorhamnose reductase